MNQLPTEALLSVFKNLNSKEMVQMMAVCRSWLEIIGNNRTLWQRLVLPEKKEGWPLSVVKLFDRKSASSLREVSIRLKEAKRRLQYLDSFVKVLLRSKSSLQYLHIIVEDAYRRDTYGRSSYLSELSWELPNLVDYVVTHDPQSPVRLLAEKPSSNLRTLWIPFGKALFQSNLHLIEFVVSLSVQQLLESRDWRRILEKPAATLKHLSFGLSQEYSAAMRQASSELPPLEFPNLRVLELSPGQSSSHWGQVSFPSWMKIPPSASCTIATEVPELLPSVSTLWAMDPTGLQSLKARCPVLVELRVDRPIRGNGLWLYKDLLPALRLRKKSVDAGIEVDGVKMIHLKRLVIDSKGIGNNLSELRDLADEVLDLKTVERFIEVQI